MVLNSFCVYPQVEKYLMVKGNVKRWEQGEDKPIMIATGNWQLRREITDKIKLKMISYVFHADFNL